MSRDGIEVSVIIPARNEAANIGACLDAVQAQRFAGAREIIVIDSGSLDGTAPLVEARRDVRLVRIDAGEFGHGRTRNLGARLARGDFLVFLNADALPRDENWLSALIGEFGDDGGIAGVFSRHLPRSGCHAYMARDLLGAMPGRRRVISRAGRLDTFLFSTVSGAVRRQAWEAHPFHDGIAIAEDQEWARRVLEAGWRIVYAPGSAVIHSHNYTAREHFRTKLLVGRSSPAFSNPAAALLGGFFLAAGGMTFKLLGDVPHILGPKVPLRRKPAELLLSLKARAAGFAGRYAGWLQAARRR